jgi:thioredoxin-related protein
METDMNIVLTLWLGILACAMTPTWAGGDLPMARNLQKDGKDATDREAVVLVAFVGEKCRYCDTVVNEFLVPMTHNPDYQRKVVMRRVETSSPQSLKDFSGNAASHREFAGQHGVRMVPTIMLFDDKGRVLAKPLVGLTTVDYYGMYLDEAIDTALGKLRKLMPGGPWGS